jgi:protein phosphatase
MRLTAAGFTDSGPRPTNQDCYFVDVGLGLFVVADGMGGHNAGEVASRMAVDAVVDFIRTSRLNPQMTWPFPFDPQRSMGANRVEAAIKMANIRVHDAGLGENPSQTGMGTTLVVLLIEGAQMVIGHAGDSRAYRMRDTGLEQMTVDDTWVNAMLGEGAASAKDHPMRHVLTSGVGMRLDLVPTVAEERIEPSERWLITSDGVHGYVPPIGLARGLLAGTADDAARRIVHAALDGATSDNSTAVVVRIDP